MSHITLFLCFQRSAGASRKWLITFRAMEGSTLKYGGGAPFVMWGGGGAICYIMTTKMSLLTERNQMG